MLEAIIELSKASDAEVATKFKDVLAYLKRL